MSLEDYSSPGLFVSLVLVGGPLLERSAQDVAQGRAGIRGAVLSDRFLLFGHFQRLDRDRELARLAVELGHAGIDLLADLEAVGALVVAIAGQIGAADEGVEIGAGDFHIETGLLHVRHFAGDDIALFEIAAGRAFRHRVGATELLDAKRDAFLLDIDVEHGRLHLVALLVFLDHLLARTLPVEIGKMDHAVHIAVEAEEQPELGLVLDFAFDDRAGRILLDEHFPRIAHSLLETERNAALDRIDFEDLDFDFLRGRDDLAGMNVLLGPRHFGNVDQAFDARLQFDERAVVGDVGHATLEAGADRIFRFDALPRIVEQLLHAERDTMGLVVDLDDLHLHRLTDIEHFGRVIDATPRNVGDMEKTVDAAEINERTVI